MTKMKELSRTSGNNSMIVEEQTELDAMSGYSVIDGTACGVLTMMGTGKKKSGRIAGFR